MKDYKPGYEGLSMAVLISKVSAVPKTCVILSSHRVNSGEGIIGYARDIETNQQLSTAPLERILDGGTHYATNISLRWSEKELTILDLRVTCHDLFIISYQETESIPSLLCDSFPASI
jgi:hypothetical protein